MFEANVFAMLQRVGVLMEKHDESVKLLEAKTPKQKLWYLEVIAVHPSLQSRGLGGGVMRWVLEHIQDEPIYLECTREENVAFYESFGFEVAEVVKMFEDGSESDSDHGFKHWVMVRPGKSGS
jgi:ribosomal protein S18 acetylase RimI-like enzyme